MYFRLKCYNFDMAKCLEKGFCRILREMAVEPFLEHGD